MLFKSYDKMKQQLYRITEQDLQKMIKESVNRIINEIGGASSGFYDRTMQKYNRFNDDSNNPYSDEGRYYRHLETEPQGIEEGRYYNPRTYERDESKEFTHDDIKKLVSILKENPIEEMWKPYDLGWCKVQRVEANLTSGRSYLLSDPHNMTAPQDMYSDGNNGIIYLKIGRMPNTNWFDESGYTYMCWK